MLLKPLGLLKTKLQQLRNTRISSNTRIFTINCIIFWDFLMLFQTLLSPQVKRCAIITYKNGIYELSNDIRLRKLGNISRISKLHRMIAWRPAPPPNRKFCQCYQKTLKKQKLNSPRSAPPHTKTTASLKYPASGRPRKLPPGLNLPQSPLNPTPLTISPTTMPFTPL